MTNGKPTAEEPALNCEVCLTEIPESVAQSLEGEDYVHYFCGSDCFEKWKTQHHATEQEESQ